MYSDDTTDGRNLNRLSGIFSLHRSPSIQSIQSLLGGLGKKRTFVCVCGVGVWEECVGVCVGGAIHCSQQVIMFSIHVLSSHVLSSHTNFFTVKCLVVFSSLYVNMTYRSLIVSM